MLRSVKVLSVFITTLVSLTAFGTIASGQGGAETDMREVRRTLIEKGKVPAAAAEEIKMLPLPAVAVFKLAGQDAEANEIDQAYNDAMRTIPQGR